MKIVRLGKWRILLVLILFMCICFIITSIRRQTNPLPRTYILQKPQVLPLILWWNAMPANHEYSKLCDGYFCRFSSWRKHLTKAKAVLFYGSDIQVADFPLPRHSEQWWALFHEESPRNVEFMPYDTFLQHFNFTSTISQHSDVPLTTYYLPKVEDLTNSKYMIPVAEKSHQIKGGKGLVLFVQSDCDTASGREYYVKELMKYVRIDSYGACLKNMELPDALKQQQHDYLNNLYSPEVLRFVASYKFVIAYENGVCYDYITEKLWRPLIAGSIPIYFGAPNIKEWIPNEKSIINISNFDSVEKLADFIKLLDANETEYNTYLNHKFQMIQPIKNEFLLRALQKRQSSINDGKVFETFECAVCTELHKHSTHVHKASELVYQCPHQPVYPPMTGAIHNTNDWRSIMSMGKCKAYTLNKLLARNKNYTEAEFIDLLSKEIDLNNCYHIPDK